MLSHKQPESQEQTVIANKIDDNINDNNRGGFSKWFQRIASSITRATGSPGAFIIATAIILIWAVTGPVFHYSDTWQLVINTGTTVVTFLMVFVIQQSQNKDSLAVQLKLNELIASDERASNRLIVVEELSQEELEVLKKFYIRLSETAKKERDLRTSHSVEEAEELSKRKHLTIKLQKDKALEK